MLQVYLREERPSCSKEEMSLFQRKRCHQSRSQYHSWHSWHLNSVHLSQKLELSSQQRATRINYSFSAIKQRVNCNFTGIFLVIICVWHLKECVVFIFCISSACSFHFGAITWKVLHHRICFINKKREDCRIKKTNSESHSEEIPDPGTNPSP